MNLPAVVKTYACLLCACASSLAHPFIALSPDAQKNSVLLVLGGSENSKVAGLQWNLKFLPSEVAIDDITAGPALKKAGKQLYCTARPGVYVCIAAGLNQTAIGNGTVAQVQFRLITESATLEVTEKRGSTVAAGSISILGTSKIALHRAKE